MQTDYFEQENEEVKKLFDLDKIIELQTNHDIQVIREADYNYMCYIDKEGYGSALTPMGALVFGIKQFEKKQ